MFIISLKISQRVAATFSHLGSEWGDMDTIPQAVFKTGYNITSKACSGTTMSRRAVGTELLPHPDQDLAKPGRVWAKGKQKCHAISYSFECCVFLIYPLDYLWPLAIVQFSSVQSLSRVQLCNLMDCNTPGLTVHHQLPESTKLTSIELVMPPTISSSVVPFSSRPQFFPPPESFQMSQFFTSGGQSIGVSASTSVLPLNIQNWSPLGWAGWISLQPKGLSRVFSNTTVQKHQFLSAQLSL